MACRQRIFPERVRLVAVVALAVGSTPPQAGAEFPEKPVEIIVPFAAGGGSDVFVRIIQKAGQTIGERS